MAITDQSISIVVPVYGCKDCLGLLCERLSATLCDITASYEIIFVDDRSLDDSWAEIVKLQQQNAHLKGVRLSRNFGQHIAISAGLAESVGDVVVVMDCDLQDPPELIADLYEKLLEGYDLVLARRIERNHSWFRVVSARIYFKLMGHLTEERVDGSYGSYSMLTRKVVDCFLKFGERERHYLFIIRWLGFEMVSVDYVHDERTIGRSSYTIGRLIRHAFDGIFFQSTMFLRWIVALGLCFAVFGLALAAYFVYQYFAHSTVEGWTSVVVLMLICTGVLLSSLGVIGLYIGKIFNQTKGRPLYLVDTISDRSAQW